MNRSIPMEKCWEDAMIAYGQNGEAIRPEQGYPLRLVLPGWEGNRSDLVVHRGAFGSVGVARTDSA